MITMYFLIALIALEIDALCCHIMAIRFKVWTAVLFALVWPLSAVLAILGVIGDQKRNGV
jgi:hypothetical protein